MDYLVVSFFSFQVFGNFSFIFLVLIYSLIPFWPENTLYDLNYSKCVEVCFVAQDIVGVDLYSMST